MSLIVHHPWFPSSLRTTLGLGDYDPTHGRGKLPLNGHEELFHSAPYRTTDTTTLFGSHRIFSTTWELESSTPVADIIHIHGLHDYGTRWADTDWPKAFVEARFRVTSPDLVGHGRSSGVHGAFTSIDEQVDAVREVIIKAVRGMAPSESGKIFILAGSLGGLVALSYARKYGQDSQASPSGMVILCPLVSAAADSRPSWTVELIAKALSRVAPSLPLAEANRGKNGGDEEAFFSDPLTYHGRLRIGTGLAMLYGFENLQAHLEEIKTPFVVIHGDSDRVTSPQGSQVLYERASPSDKTIQIIQGQEHDLIREPKAAEILAICLEWLNKRV
ncbi:hypothetical protein SpCBS45565_g02311 [Spizellomyces sp. 'palustris']|nr:hypothetical protein SpCBS45565_g02311 [Spizellomyces sp. 'palustris']